MKADIETTVRFTLAAVTAALLCAGAAGADEWGYSGDHGPGFWSRTPGWEACAATAATERQSPIDIGDVTADPQLTPLRVQLRPTPLSLVNNGHTVEQEYEAGSTLTADGVTYALRQFHFHTPSEHTVDGRRADIELHAVFADPASDKAAVIAVLYTVGAANPFLARLLKSGLPKKPGDEIHMPARTINLAETFDVSRYYTYPGSLTTPPCSETVTWFVLKTQPSLSREQLEAFHRIMGDDSRPVQEINHRVVRATADAAR
jgi:carbonic anhydrase